MTMWVHPCRVLPSSFTALLLAVSSYHPHAVRADGEMVGNTVIGRCRAMWEVSEPTESMVDMDASLVPEEIKAILSDFQLQWEAVDDTVRSALLWSYGYVWHGVPNDSGEKLSQLAKVYTDCARGASTGVSDNRLGKSMEDTYMAQSKFTSAGCTVSKCGYQISLATNSECKSELWNRVACAIAPASNALIPESKGPVWASAEGVATLPYPQVYSHKLNLDKGSGDKETASFIAIHFHNDDITTACQNTGDDVIPCMATTSAAAQERSLCRPAVNEDSIRVFLTAAKSKYTANQKAEPNDQGSDSTILVIAFVIGVLIILLAAVAVYLWLKRRNDGNEKVKDVDIESPTRPGDEDYQPEPGYGDSNMPPSIRANNTTDFGMKTIEQYMKESDVLRQFFADENVQTRFIPFQDITFLRQLSKGAFGEVMLGQLETRHVAIKKLLPEKRHTPSWKRDLEQFASEIQLMCVFNHVNVVRLVGISWSLDIADLCAVAEYMEMGDLMQVLSRLQHRLTWPKEKISIAMGIAEALVYLHSVHVIHRDLKSRNVLLNKKFHAKLSDFGVSRRAAINETYTSGVGTLLWTAPEIVMGKRYTEKADVYSFGVVLSEIDTCEAPFSKMRNANGEKMAGMCVAELVRLGKLEVSLSDDCPPVMRDLVKQCTNIDQDFRPSSMEVAFRLKSVIAPALRKKSTPPPA